MPDLLAEQTRLGLDKRDERWEGELRVVPPPSYEHLRMENELHAVLCPLALQQGLRMFAETGLFEPGVPTPMSYWVPDLMVFDPAVASERGIEGAAALVIEIRSPGDETVAKLPHYDRIGVAEVLVIDRDTKALHHWTRTDEHLTGAAAGAVVTLTCLPLILRTEGTRLHVKTPDREQRI